MPSLIPPYPAAPNAEDARPDNGERPAKVSSHESTSLTVPSVPYRARSLSPDTVSLVSADIGDLHELRLSRTASNNANAARRASKSTPTPQPGKGIRAKIHAIWRRNLGVLLVLAAQVFGVLMNVSTRLLEQGNEHDEGMHPFQILFARQSITALLSTLYMWWTATPDFPFGPRGVWLLLVARGFGGFWGVFGLYWSLQYLPLADATVLSFLAPILACYACSKLINEPFTRVEQIGGLLSLAGVVLITRPTTLFSPNPIDTAGGANNNAIPEPTSSQRLQAVGMSMVGVLGAAVAYTTIRWIGQRAHALISVNYFAVWCTIVSAFFLIFIPSVPFVFPSSPWQWFLLIAIGVSGFTLQFLLTAGLCYEKSSRAQHMVFTSMLFALGADRIIWGIVPDGWSLAGGGIILGCAIVVAVQKESKKRQMEPVTEGVGSAREADEEMGLVAHAEHASEEDLAEEVEMQERGRSLERIEEHDGEL